ncbi:MAG: hypothetical protein WCG91_01325 [Candidatus Shapirobacteria bacterium]
MSFFDRFKRENIEEVVYPTKCGHEAKPFNEAVKVFGEEINIFLRPVNGVIDLCLNCYLKMIRKCPSCGELIHPGDPIVFRQVDESENFDLVRNNEYIIVSLRNKQVAGCTKCSEINIVHGHWNKKGKIERLIKVS